MEDGTAHRRLLIVDDEPVIRTLLSQKLARHGFTCATSPSGEHSLELLSRETFDAIISDLNLPGVSGLVLLKEVLAQHRGTAFIMITGEGDVRAGVQAMQSGADDYLVKPFAFDSMLGSVERALDKKRHEAELEQYRLRLEELVDERSKQYATARIQIELTYDETLGALGAALDLRDTETEGHSRRVSRYAMEMARTYGCSEEELKHIVRGSYLHDIGKIGIPDSILLKPAKLTEEETAVMQTHARIGYELLQRIAFLEPAAEIVLTHQEKFDGTGYPQGLAGAQIPLGSRFFSVADTLDAMTSDRPYRRALPFSTARHEIERQSGRQFSPEAVKIFLSRPETIWKDIREEVSEFGEGRVFFGLPIP
ncbi:MAG TPA: HD domain-containing phosphohydrolase [Terriglobia bacterium]|nr:HD domain-containing phosphohydrolase [Terriglobia bacterium]